MFKTIMSLVSGNFAYSPPRLAIRGGDAPARMGAYLMPYLGAAVGGTGTGAGTYNRTTPYIFNTALIGIVSDLHGPAFVINSGSGPGRLLGVAK